MTSETFNSLPLEARQYIENQKACASCGKSQDTDRHYKNYLAMKNKSLYTLRLGAVVFKDAQGEGQVLYPLHPKDTEEDVKTKLAQALAVYAAAPTKFSTFSKAEIEEALAEEAETEEAETEEDETEEDETEEDETEEDENPPVKKLYGAAKKAADAKAAKDSLD
jgi:hypothetical protein